MAFPVPDVQAAGEGRLKGNYVLRQIYRRIHAKAARSPIRIPLVWSWHLGLRPRDAFLASYPRSGSTWLRFMLFEILCGEEAGFRKIEDRLPEIHTHRGVPPISPAGGRLIKTHEQYRHDYQKAVLLVRDVRDVVLSVYAGGLAMDLISIVSKGDFESFLLAFLEGKVLTMGSWQQHTRSWLESPLTKHNNLLVMQYEQLRKNPEQKIGEILQFLGISPESQAIRKAIENNSLQRMRAKEENAKKAGEQSIVLGERKHLDEDRRFVRKGSVGGWRDKLTEAQVRLIEQYTGEMLLATGYELTSIPAAAR